MVEDTQENRQENGPGAGAGAGALPREEVPRSSADARRSEAAEEITPAELARFRCIRNAAYNEDRERYYAFAHKLLMSVVVIVGTVSIGASLVHDNAWATAGTAIAVLAGLIDLLWDVDGRARLHSNLRRRCYDLLARLEIGEPPEHVRAELSRVILDEPPAMHAVNALAFNRAIDAMGWAKGQKYVLTPQQMIWRHWWPYKANEFQTIEDLEKATPSPA